MRTRWFLLGVVTGGVGSFLTILWSLSGERTEDEEEPDDPGF
jgi:hypothetical protein